MAEHSNLKLLSSALASGAANLALLIFQPFDNIKFRLQVNDGAINNPRPYFKTLKDSFKITIKNEGLAALYKGSSISFCTLCIANMIFFTTYTHIGNIIKQNKMQTKDVLVMSSIASFTSTTLCTPLWTLRTRCILLMGQNKNVTIKPFSLFNKVLSDLLKSEGPKALFNGYTAALALCSHGIIKMGLYEKLKSILLKLTSNSIAISFVSGMVSQMITSSLLYPITTVRTKLQQKQFTVSGKPNVIYDGFWNTVRVTYVRQGLRGFYRGILLQLLKLGPSFGLFFVIYEELSKRIMKVLVRFS